MTVFSSVQLLRKIETASFQGLFVILALYGDGYHVLESQVF